MVAREADHLEFHLIDTGSMERMTVCEITTKLYVGNEGPLPGGLYDPRMGPLRSEETCATCGADFERCPGHFGLLRLARPVYHPIFVPLLRSVLKATCFNCCKARVDMERPAHAEAMREAKPDLRLALAAKLGPKRCPACEAPQRTVVVLTNGNFGLEERQQDGATCVLRPDVCLERLRGIDAETRALLGLQFDPTGLILTSILVPPTSMRVPTVRGNVWTHDDLTTLLFGIIGRNDATRALLDAPPHALNGAWTELQRAVCQFFHNDPSPKAGYRPSRRGNVAMKGLVDRLGGKAGRFRGTLQGRRVDFSGRAVITPDPNIDVGEVGVPGTLARKITVEEPVTLRNLDELQACVQVGPTPDGNEIGANLIARGAFLVDLRREASVEALTLRVGDRVHRHLRDGDIVVMNRQPSLHAASMMAHRVRRLPYSTLRLNLSATTPYNADFDGDEMNLHVPQTLQARAEIWELARVAAMIVTPARGHPCMAFVQDALLAAGLLTEGGVFIERDLMFDCLLALGDAWDGTVPRPAVLRPRPLWTGAQLWSAAMRAVPASLRRPGDWLAGDGLVVCEGELLVGQLTKRLLGQAPGSIVHEVWHRHGPDATERFLSTTQRPLNLWLEARGITVGVADCVLADPAAAPAIRARIAAAHAETAALQEAVARGRLRREVGRSVRDTFEGRMRGALERASTDVSGLVRAGLARGNNIKRIVSIGSKGSVLNLQQITGCLGQQILMLERIPAWFRGRTLPHFCRSDDGAVARGFVDTGFIDGLGPAAFWFHAEASREGLIDTAIKTAESGYAQRRIIKTIEDDVVAGTGVVGTRGGVLQFAYGLDGFDGGAREQQTVDAITMSAAELAGLHGVPACLAELLRSERRLERFLADPNGVPAYRQAFPLEDAVLRDYIADLPTTIAATERWVGRILADRAAVLEDLRAVGTPPGDAARRPMPFNLDRILAEARRAYGLAPTAAAALSPLTGNDMIDEWLAGLDVADPRMLGLWVRGRLGGWRGPCEHGLTREALAYVLATAGDALVRAAVEPGAAVGTLAGQSLGEPLTQMTLNSVAWDTEVVLLERGASRRVRIGEWIDGLLAAGAPTRVDGRTDYLPVEGVRVPDVDEAGAVRWRPVEAVTRHPVVNADGSARLLRVRTRCGRSVDATKGKSFLVRRDNRIVPTTGEELRVGDYLPTVRQLPEPAAGAALGVVDVLEHIAPDPRLFLADDVIEARDRLLAATDRKAVWPEVAHLAPQHNSPRDFLAYMRRLQHKLAPGQVRFFRGSTGVPQTWPLDEETGFLLGSFVGHGWVVRSLGTVTFAACDEPDAGRIEAWLDARDIVHKRAVAKNCKAYAKIRVNSQVFAAAMHGMCVRGEKRCLPDFAAAAPAPFVRGALIGFLAHRRPNYDVCRAHFGAKSPRQEFVSSIATLLSRLGVPSLLRAETTRPNTPDRQPTYHLRVPLHHVGRACEQLLAGRCSAGLAEVLRDHLHSLATNPPTALRDDVPGVTAPSVRADNETFTRTALAGALHRLAPEERAACEAILAADVVFSRVEAIEEVDPPAGHPLVYDLTVAETRNFALANGLCVRDTFHQAGVGKAPPSVRVKELMDQPVRQKAPTTRVRFEPGTAAAEVRACAFALPQLRLEDVALGASVEYAGEDDLPEWLVSYVETETFDPAAASPLHLEVRLSEAELSRHGTDAPNIVPLVRAACPGQAVLYNEDVGEPVFRVFLAERGTSIEEASRFLCDLIARPLAGVSGITRVVMDESADVTEPTLIAAGVNMHGLWAWATSHPAGAAIDLMRTDCNDSHATAEVLGIEAATACNAAEFNAVYREAMSQVDPKHISVIADHIAWTGQLRGCTSTAMRNSIAGVLTRASFERTRLVLAKASAVGEVDRLDEVSTRVIFGRRVGTGTGTFDLRLDPEACAHALEEPPPAWGAPEAEADPLAVYGDLLPADAPMSPAPGDAVFASPAWGASPAASPAWPLSPVSPAYAPASPAWGPPAKRARFEAPYSPSSPIASLFQASPAYDPASPASPISYSPSSPTAYSPSSPTAYSPSSPAPYSPVSPAYSPSSPSMALADGTYSPSSPVRFDPMDRPGARSQHLHGRGSSHAYAGMGAPDFSACTNPASPAWDAAANPTSPSWTGAP